MVARVAAARVVVARVAVEQQGVNPRAESGAMRHLGLVVRVVAVPALVLAVPALEDHQLEAGKEADLRVSSQEESVGHHQGLAVPELVLAVPELEDHQLDRVLA